MDCRDENDRLSHGHSHSHGGHGHDDHDHDHVPPPDTNESQSLFQHIYLEHVRTLNEAGDGHGKVRL